MAAMARDESSLVVFSPTAWLSARITNVEASSSAAFSMEGSSLGIGTRASAGHMSAAGDGGAAAPTARSSAACSGHASTPGMIGGVGVVSSIVHDLLRDMAAVQGFDSARCRATPFRLVVPVCGRASGSPNPMAACVTRFSSAASGSDRWGPSETLSPSPTVSRQCSTLRSCRSVQWEVLEFVQAPPVVVPTGFDFGDPVAIG